MYVLEVVDVCMPVKLISISSVSVEMATGCVNKWIGSGVTTNSGAPKHNNCFTVADTP